MTGQLTLGDLKALFAKIPDTLEDRAYEPLVRFDFCNTFPIGFCSWRGRYDELAINWTYASYWGGRAEKAPTVNAFKKMIANADGEYTGWKGGEFIMDDATPLWVDNPGEYSSTYVTGVISQGIEIIITTEHNYDG